MVHRYYMSIIMTKQITLYLHQGSKQDKIKIPVNKESIKQVLDSYRSYLDNLVKKIEHEFKESFPASKILMLLLQPFLRN